MPLKRNGISATIIEKLIAQRVADALSDYEANHNSENGNDNRNGSHDLGSGSRRTLHTARGCTYKEFLSCQPLNFKRTKGAVAFTHWFEKMESVFYHVSAPPSKVQVAERIKGLHCCAYEKREGLRWQIKEPLLALNVENKGTIVVNARSKRIRTVKTKLEVVKHVEWCMPWEEEKSIIRLATLQMISMVKERFSHLV
uniref:Reverse transcriptase domain-containing protein n=1 Tax=Tanacetum cinerariifolium TaxID=118510 RepID=A0A699H2N9_TANCI|nr:hypothetical protein [Tanacetum cinerariifolium]